jgi:hypothetical protein
MQKYGRPSESLLGEAHKRVAAESPGMRKEFSLMMASRNGPLAD